MAKKKEWVYAIAVTGPKNLYAIPLLISDKPYILVYRTEEQARNEIEEHNNFLNGAGAPMPKRFNKLKLESKVVNLSNLIEFGVLSKSKLSKQDRRHKRYRSYSSVESKPLD
jgi:hypothetical protein